MVPLLIKYIGAEAYGLVGFFYLLQAWFAILDMGLSPTMIREAARYNGGITNALSYRRLVRSLEGIFLAVAVIGGVSLFSATGYIAQDWLRPTQLPFNEVKQSLQLMAITVALRWMCGLYRGVISGSERLVWLGIFNSVMATLRSVVVLPFLMFISAEPIDFFTFQMVVSIIELIGLVLYSYLLLPNIPRGQALTWKWAPLKPVLKFSMSIAFTSSVWVLATQTDKLVLSKLMPLAEYGYFTVAVMVASGIMIISGPVTSAILPRMSKLEAEGNHKGLIKVYRDATQLVAVTSGAVAITVAFFSETLLWIWTGNRSLSVQAAPILSLYALGNGVLSVAGMPYNLQYAKGDMRIHMIGNAVFVVLLIPIIIWAASNFGGIGAGYTWLTINLISFVAWLPLVHRKFEPGLNIKWYLEDIFCIIVPMLIVGYLIRQVVSLEADRIHQLFVLAIDSMAILSAGFLGSSYFRTKARNFLWMEGGAK